MSHIRVCYIHIYIYTCLCTSVLPLIPYFLHYQSPPKGATIPYRPKPAMPPVIFSGGQAYTIQGQYALPQQADVSLSPYIPTFNKIVVLQYSIYILYYSSTTILPSPYYSHSSTLICSSKHQTNVEENVKIRGNQSSYDCNRSQT